jgi:hypothetical protein
LKRPLRYTMAGCLGTLLRLGVRAFGVEQNTLNNSGKGCI